MTKCEYCGTTHNLSSCHKCGAPAPVIDTRVGDAVFESVLARTMKDQAFEYNDQVDAVYHGMIAEQQDEDTRIEGESMTNLYTVLSILATIFLCSLIFWKYV